MLSDYGTLIFFLLLLVVGYMVFDTYWNKDTEWVRSTIDQRDYLVRPLPDKTDAANLLAQIRAGLEQVVSHFARTEPDDPRTKRMLENYRPDKLMEGNEDVKYTSYSINKGEKIVFCLRSRDGKNTLVDLNTMMFVALHELSHLITLSIGHTDEFWDNFKWILEGAVNIGIYKDQDYKKAPKAYCGIKITDNPLHNDYSESESKKKVNNDIVVK
jgi:WLM domain